MYVEHQAHLSAVVSFIHCFQLLDTSQINLEWAPFLPRWALPLALLDWQAIAAIVSQGLTEPVSISGGMAEGQPLQQQGKGSAGRAFPSTSMNAVTADEPEYFLAPVTSDCQIATGIPMWSNRGDFRSKYRMLPDHSRIQWHKVTAENTGPG